MFMFVIDDQVIRQCSNDSLQSGFNEQHTFFRNYNLYYLLRITKITAKIEFENSQHANKQIA